MAREGEEGRAVVVVLVALLVVGLLGVVAAVVVARSIDNGVPEPDAVLTRERTTASVEVGDLVEVHLASATSLGDEWRYELPAGIRHLSEEVRLGSGEEEGGTFVVMLKVEAAGPHRLDFTRCEAAGCTGPGVEDLRFTLRAA